MAAADPTSADALPTLRDDVRGALRHAAIGVAAGAICGFVVGGVLGRLAMLVLRLTSADNVIGVETDDGFEVGRVTLGGSLNLAFVYTVGGVILGLLYALARRFLPQRGRLLAFSAVTAALGGATFVHADGIDYALLDPLWLAVAFFVALPALAGLSVAWLVERLEARGAPFSRRHAVAGLASLLLVFPAIVGGLLIALGRLPSLRRLADTPWVQALALGIVVVLTVAGMLSLIDDSRVILAR
jgi:hypothetical protein